jgi:hypothetical protein
MFLIAALGGADRSVSCLGHFIPAPIEQTTVWTLKSMRSLVSGGNQSTISLSSRPQHGHCSYLLWSIRGLLESTEHVGLFFHGESYIHYNSSFKHLSLVITDRDSVFGIAIRYGLDGPGIKFWYPAPYTKFSPKVMSNSFL